MMTTIYQNIITGVATTALWMGAWSFQSAAAESQDWREFLEQNPFGAIGDSNTDEYKGRSNFAGRNWLELLAELRGFRFGEYSDDSRGEPRNTGYANNWARVGQPSGGPTWVEVFPALAEGCEKMPGGFHCLFSESTPVKESVAGLAAQIKAGEVKTAYIGLGHNDIAIYGRAQKKPLEGNEFSSFKTQLVDRVMTIVDELNAAGSDSVKVIVGAPGRPGPWYREDGQSNLKAVQDVGDTMEQAAKQRNAGYVDLWGFLRSETRVPDGSHMVVGSERIEIGSVAPKANLVQPGTETASGHCRTVGPEWRDKDIEASQVRCADAAYSLNHYLDDGGHMGTVANGLAANQFIQAVNDTYNVAIPLLSDKEILEAAGVAEE